MKPLPVSPRPERIPLPEAIARKLGQRNVRSEVELARLVAEGLPVDAIDSLTESGVQAGEVYKLVVPRRTLDHRRARAERLSEDESAAAVRLARVTALAERVFGDSQRARRWLRTPKRRFSGRAPIDTLSNDIWARLVEDSLRQIEHGIFG